MSDELRLPDDLAALEARLAAQSLPASGVNRDELMYRAGWAACEARGRGALPLVDRSPRPASSQVAAWSLASAALAASLAVAATLFLQSPRGVQLATESNSIPPADARTAVATAAQSPAMAPAQVAAFADYVTLISDPDARDFVSPLLAIQRRQLRFDSRRSAPETVANVISAPSPKTASQLRDEYLPTLNQPHSDRRTPLVWPWSTPATGESI